jgi:DNA-binding PadR family transcriptional regulator
MNEKHKIILSALAEAGNYLTVSEISERLEPSEVALIGGNIGIAKALDAMRRKGVQVKQREGVHRSGVGRMRMTWAITQEGRAALTKLDAAGEAAQSDSALSSEPVIEPGLVAAVSDVEPDNGNWIPWNGGDQPVQDHERVDFWFSDGGRIHNETAGAFHWNGTGKDKILYWRPAAVVLSKVILNLEDPFESALANLAEVWRQSQPATKFSNIEGKINALDKLIAMEFNDAMLSLLSDIREDYWTMVGGDDAP